MLERWQVSARRPMYDALAAMAPVHRCHGRPVTFTFATFTDTVTGIETAGNTPRP